MIDLTEPVIDPDTWEPAACGWPGGCDEDAVARVPSIICPTMCHQHLVAYRDRNDPFGLASVEVHTVTYRDGEYVRTDG